MKNSYAMLRLLLKKTSGEYIMCRVTNKPIGLPVMRSLVFTVLSLLCIFAFTSEGWANSHRPELQDSDSKHLEKKHSESKHLEKNKSKPERREHKKPSSVSILVNKNLRAAVLDSAVKVRREERLPGKTNRAKNIKMSAARNEYETAQLVLTSLRGGVKNVMVRLTALRGKKGKIPASNIELLLAQYVRVDAPSDSIGAKGWWPDALVPLRRPFKIGAHRNQSVWLKVFVPRGTKPGLYKGLLKITSPGAPALKVGVSLRVWDFTLEKENHLPIVFGMDYGSVYKFGPKVSSEAEFDDEVLPSYYEMLQRNRSYPINLFNALPQYRESRGKVVVNFDNLKRHLDKAYKYGPVGQVSIPITESWPVDTNRYPMFSKEYNSRIVSYLRQIAKFYEKLGLLEKSYIYLTAADEPDNMEQYQYIREFAKLVHEAHPRLRFLQTVHAACRDCGGGGVESLDHDATLWAPNISFFDNVALKAEYRAFGLGGIKVSPTPAGWSGAFSTRLKKRGAKIWWYLNPWTFVLPGPTPRYPTLFIDHPGIEHRIVAWMAYKYGISGIGHWNATFWQTVSNPWTTVTRGEGGAGANGDGSLIYPGYNTSRYTGQPDPKGPVTTIRLELLREGSEDFELLRILKVSGKERLSHIIVNKIVNSLQDYKSDPRALKTARVKIAEDIVKLKKAGTLAARYH